MKISLNVTVLLLRKEKWLIVLKLREFCSYFSELASTYFSFFFSICWKGFRRLLGENSMKHLTEKKGLFQIVFQFLLSNLLSRTKKIQLFLVVTLHFGCVVIIPMQAVKYSWFLYYQATLVGHAVSIGANYATNPCKRIKYCEKF